MTIQEILNAAQRLNIADQIHLVSQLIQLVEQSLTSESSDALRIAAIPQNGEASRLNPISSATSHSLKGKVIQYDNPYEPVALNDWDAIA